MASIHAETCAHGLALDPLKPCKQCLLDPGPMPEPERLPDDDTESVAAEFRIRDVRDLLHGALKGFLSHRKETESQDAKGVNTACKLAEVLLKYERTEQEWRDKRIQRAHEKYCADAARDLAGVGSH